MQKNLFNMDKDYIHTFEICNSICPLVRQCGRSHIHFSKHKVLEYPVHSFLPKTGDCLSRIDLTKAQEEDVD